MKRHLLINILLVIAGIVLALVLFGAGVMWKGTAKSAHPSVSALATENYRSPACKSQMKKHMRGESVAATLAVRPV